MGKKGKIIGSIIGAIIVGMIVFGLQYYESSSNPQGITDVSNFAIVRDGAGYQAQFSLTNKDGLRVVSDVEVHLIVWKDDGYTKLHEEFFDIEADDFHTFRAAVTEDEVLGYKWNFAGNEIRQQPPDSTLGHIYVKLPSGKEFYSVTSIF